MRRALTAIALAGAMTLGACGGDDGGDVRADGATTTTAAATTAEAGGTDDAASDTTATGSDTTDVVFSGRGSAEFCNRLKELQDDDSLDNLFSDTATPEENRRALARSTEILRELERKAPAEIKGDVSKLTEGFLVLAKVFERYDFDAEKVFTAASTDTALEAELEVLNSPEFEAANQRLDQYTSEVCGITDTTSG